MSANFFIDTNILVYFVDQKSPKQLLSEQIVLTALQSGEGIISTQVVQEFINIATGKFLIQLKPFDTILFLESILFPLCLVYPDIDLYKFSIEIKTETQYSFYDSLIIASALRANCSVLYTEDMQSGQIIRGMKIVNPYLSGFKLMQ